MNNEAEQEHEVGLLQRVLEGLRKDEHFTMGIGGRQKLVEILAGLSEPLRTELVNEILNTYLDDVIELVKAIRSTRNNVAISHKADSAPYHRQEGENVAFHTVIKALEFQKEGLK